MAEREHLKWKNAQAIPNNPYSAEALKRRLSQPSNYQSKIVDVHRNVAPSYNTNIEQLQPKGIDPIISDRDHIR